MLFRTELPRADLQLLSDLIPGQEPVVAEAVSGPRRGRSYWVAETNLSGNERRYLNECIDTNWISSRGPFVSRFEAAFAREAGCSYGVSCANGTVALHLAIAALGIGPGDEVVIPTFTMVATANAVRYTGATVKLVDAEPTYLNMDPDRVEAALTARTKAIIVVHTYGHCAAMPRLQTIAQERGLALIEDAAEAHGAELGGARAGSFGRASTFSFYGNKIITTGEGGMVCTDDEQLAAVMRLLRDHAISKERHFWHEYVGFNYRMTNLQAAVGLAQTERLDEIVASRRRLRDWYDARLRDVPGLRIPQEESGARSVFWMYGIRVGPEFGWGRNALRDELARRGVETRTFFIPIHLQPIYFEFFRGQPYPVAEELCRTGLYLPTSEVLQEPDVEWICEQIVDIGHRSPPI